MPDRPTMDAERRPASDPVKSMLDRMKENNERIARRLGQAAPLQADPQTDPDRAEYERILKGLKDGEDPLENGRIREIIVKDLQRVGLGESAHSVLGKIRGIPRESRDYRDIYVYLFFAYRRATGAHNGFNGVFVPYENKMYINMQAQITEQAFLQTFFHETGHAVDHNSGRISQTAALFQALQEDTRDFIRVPLAYYGSALTEPQKQRVLDAFLSGKCAEATIESGAPVGHPPAWLDAEEKEVYNKVVQACYYMLMRAPHQSDTIAWDVMTGITNNAITSGGGHLKAYAKTNYYWYGPNGRPTGNAESEAWAEHYSAIANSDTEAIDVNRQQMPHATVVLGQLADTAAQRFRRKYRG